MPVEILFSHNLNCLADALADAVMESGRREDPLQTQVVVVPNPQIRKWLQLMIAERHGIAANIAYPYLQDGLWDLLISLADQPGAASGWRHLTTEPFQLMVFAYLAAAIRQTAHRTKGLEPIAFMLHDASGNPCLNFDQRLWQLSGQLARYMNEYEFHRQDMIQAWNRGEIGLKNAGQDPEWERMAQCQLKIYRELFGKGGVRDRLTDKIGTAYYTLPQLANLVIPRTRNRRERNAVPVCHVFGLSQLSTFRRDLIMQLGAFHNIRMYQLNVCSEFWEDVSTPREDRWSRLRGLTTITNQDDEENLEWDQNENELLKSLGKPGRENIKLLSELEERAGAGSVQTDWLLSPPPCPPETCLHRVQEQVLTRTTGTPDQALAQDDSIQIAGCPSRFREVETVHNSILHNLATNPDLQASDIAILVPAMADYKPLIRSVFERDPAAVEYNLTDSTAARDSVYGQALLQLLKLAGGDFSRRDVFDLLFSPCFLAAHDLQREDVLTWVQWAHELNIFHSFDAHHRRVRGLPGNDLYTWQQGFRRLRLGRIMQGDADTPDPDQFRVYAGVKAFEDTASADAERVGRFGALVEALFQKMEKFQKAQLSCKEWRIRLRELADLFLGIPKDRPEEAIVRQRLFDGLKQSGRIDELLPIAGGTASLSLETMVEFVKSNLDAIPSRKGTYLSGGVTVSELRPNRAVPFEIVYIMGLGEGEFPRSPDYSSLDLRLPGRKLGDISRPEEERYVFLETLMCTRQKLYLSYVNHNLQKDQIRHPCSLIVQMQRYLQQQVVHKEFKCVRVPLTGAAREYLEPTPAWHDLLVNHAPHERLLCLQTILRDSPEAQIDTRLREHVLAELEQHAAKPKAPAVRTHAADEPAKLALSHLYNFLLNPVEAGLRWRLHLYEWEEEDPAHAVDEPFFSNTQVERELVLKALDYYIVHSTKELLEEARLDAYIDSLYMDYRHKSCVPDGAFGELDQQRIRNVVLERVAGYGEVSDPLAELVECYQGWELFTDVCIGTPSATRRPAMCFPALKLRLADRRFEICGNLDYIWRHPDSRDCAFLVLSSARAGRMKIPPRSVLRPFLFYLLLRALPETHQNWMGNQAIRIHVAGRDAIREFRYNLPPERAREILQDMLADLNGDAAFDLIPFDLVTNLRNSDIPLPHVPRSNASPGEKFAYARRLQLEADEAIDNPFSSWLPSPLIRLVNAHVPEDAWDKIQRRLAPFFDVLDEP